MYIKAATLDDLLNKVLKKLLKEGRGRIRPTRGAAVEKTGVLVHLENPRARLSRTAQRVQLFGCIGELLWYLSKRNSLAFISYYLPKYLSESEDGKVVYSGYGPRLFNMRGADQVANVIDLLAKKQDTRRAVIQIFDASDISSDRREVPCTCSIQFMVRNKRLNAIVSMRSNDAYIGLPHDVFAFTMLQEIIATSLGLRLGTYKHMVGSLHLYEANKAAARRYVEEGFQETTEMPHMPIDNPWPSLRKLSRAEASIRNGTILDPVRLDLHDYWSDIIRLLNVFRLAKDGNTRGIKIQKSLMSTKIYDAYIDQKRRRVKRSVETLPVQAPLFTDDSVEGNV